MKTTVPQIPPTPGVYLIRNSGSGKIYIGSSFNMKTRCAGHLRQLRTGRHRNPYLQRAWNKYGEEVWDFSVLEETQDYLSAEQKWIDLLRPFDEAGYNLQPEARTSKGYKQSPEHIEKRISPLRGRTQPDNVREGVAEANRKRVWTEEQKRRNRERVWMNKSGKSKRVERHLVPELTSEGWTAGRG